MNKTPTQSAEQSTFSSYMYYTYKTCNLVRFIKAKSGTSCIKFFDKSLKCEYSKKTQLKFEYRLSNSIRMLKSNIERTMS